MAYDYQLLTVTQTNQLAEVVISNPPINLITQQLFGEWMALAEELEADPDLTVILFKSADPDFFMAHFDVELILSFPVDGPAERSTDPNPFHVMCKRFRSMNKITIAQVEGRVGGGGNEIISNMDMRFGVEGKTIINQMEVPLGILPGGTGTQNLANIIGHARAMEVILGAEDLDAETAERWGYLNRIYAADEIDDKVRTFVQRIANFPVEAVRLAKQSINNAAAPLDKGLAEESFLFQQLIRTPDARSKMQKFLDDGGQTRDGELRLDILIDQLKTRDFSIATLLECLTATANVGAKFGLGQLLGYRKTLCRIGDIICLIRRFCRRAPSAGSNGGCRRRADDGNRIAQQQ